MKDLILNLLLIAGIFVFWCIYVATRVAAPWLVILELGLFCTVMFLLACWLCTKYVFGMLLKHASNNQK